MNDVAKTVGAVVIALALAGGAWLTRPAPATVAQFSDAGEEFFPAFTDPLKAKSLEVVGYDEATARFIPFKVEFDGTRWVIPSHHNYPADATQNMAEAATVFIGLKKEQVVSDGTARHQELGVLAPDDDKAPLSGRGTRVTIKDQAGGILSDLIIGGEQKDAQGAPTGKRYVRLPDKNRVYAVQFTKGLSTKFADWVQTDLLKVMGVIDRVTIDNYQIDEQAGRKQSKEMVELRRVMVEQSLPADAPEGSAKPAPKPEWKLTAEPAGPPSPGEVVNETRVTELTDSLRGMRIVGVRPKPQKLAEYFSGTGKSVSLDPLDIMALQSRGFYVTQDAQLLANEGELEFALEDGLIYNIYFGEALYGDGETLSAGKDEKPGASGAPGAAGPEPDSADAKTPKESRFVFVNVQLDESKLPKPPEPPQPPQSPATPAESPAAPNEGVSPDSTPAAGEPAPGGAKNDEPSPAAAEAAPGAMLKDAAPASGAAKTPEQQAYEEAKKEYDRAVEMHERRVKAIRDRVNNLQKSFAPWYYLIDGETFKKIRPMRADLLMAAPTPAPAPAPGGAPNPVPEQPSMSGGS